MSKGSPTERRPISPLFGGNVKERTKSGTVRKETTPSEPQNLEEAQAYLQEVQSEMQKNQSEIKALEREIETPSPESPLAESYKKQEEAALMVQEAVKEITRLNAEDEAPLKGNASPEDVLNHLARNRDSLLEVTRASREYDEAVNLLQVRQKDSVREAKNIRAAIDHLQGEYVLFENEAGRRAAILAKFAAEQKKTAAA